MSLRPGGTSRCCGTPALHGTRHRLCPGRAVAQNVERDRFDARFLIKSARVSVFGTPESRGRVGETVKLEPMTTLSALARATSRLALIAV